MEPHDKSFNDNVEAVEGSYFAVVQEDFEEVGRRTGVAPVKLCASVIAPCYRRRVFWCNFWISEMVMAVGAVSAARPFSIRMRLLAHRLGWRRHFRRRATG